VYLNCLASAKRSSRRDRLSALSCFINESTGVPGEIASRELKEVLILRV
jgi:hypothetical protein